MSRSLFGAGKLRGWPARPVLPSRAAIGGSPLATRRSSLKTSLRAIERAFVEIDATLRRLDKRVRNAERASRRTNGRRPAKLTPKRRAQLKLQGAYMGYVRQLKPAQKARVKVIKAKRGFEAAIRVARRVAGT